MPKDEGDKRSFIEQARRRQIIDAAVETIAELGYANASFAKIAERAAISPSLISYHFASKGDLLAAVRTSVVGEMDAALTEATEGARSYVDVVGRLVRGFVHFTDANRSGMYALREINIATSGGDNDPGGGGAREFEELLTEGQAAGEFRDFDVPTMARTAMAVLESVPGRLYGDASADPDLIANELATTLELAVAKKRRRVR